MKRRKFLTGFGTYAILGSAIRPVMAQSARAFGIEPNVKRDQSAAFQRMVERAAQLRETIELPAGRYALSNIQLPSNSKIVGDGATLVSTGPHPVLTAQNAGSINISGMTISADGRGPTEETVGLIDFRQIENLELSGLTLTGARNDAIYAEHVAGKIENCEISSAGRLGIYAVESLGLSILNNQVSHCGDGGIIVHRWENGPDGTIIANNRINNIGATRGGTGQWGNGINVFRADDVIVENNHIADCAFTAVRANTTKNTQIVRNICLRSGETALFVEFAFRNATIINNTVVGAAVGITTTNLDHGGAGSIIRGNTVRDITALGPYQPEPPYFGHGIAVEADSVVSDNIIENTDGYGINVGWGPYLRDVSVINNVISRAEIGIGVTAVEGAGLATIESNSINARNGAIRSHQWANIAPVDLAENPSLAPANIKIVNNRVI